MSQTVTTGADVTLRCLINIQSYPPPSVRWTHTAATGEGTPVALNAPTSFLADNDQQLTLMNVVASDAGTYTCTAVNQLGNQSAEAVVQVVPG